MNLILSTHNVTLTKAIEEHIISRINKLEKLNHYAINTRVTLEHDQTKAPERQFSCSIRLAVPGPDLFAEDHDADLYAAIDKVTKKFGDFVAVDDLSVEIPTGVVYGFIGPNGAGKTTTIKILTTLLLPTSGTARVAGFDVVTETSRIRRVMNMVSGGEQSGYGILTVRENIWLFARIYGVPTAVIKERTDEMLESDEERGKRNDHERGEA